MDKTKSAIALDTAKKYAFEAYPSWSAAHPDKACPENLVDLNEYMNEKDTKDPWGHDYQMFCGKAARDPYLVGLIRQAAALNERLGPPPGVGRAWGGGAESKPRKPAAKSRHRGKRTMARK
jgi:hypothetical protein